MISKSDKIYAEFIADGYYFDEVKGVLSDGRLTLRAVSKIDNKTNINVLTTLQSGRIKQLIKDGASYEDALVQSQDEVLNIFMIDEDNISDFSKMNIVESGASNSILLAISSILQQNRGVSDV